MSSHLFHVQEHTFSCSHIRGYPYATADSQEEVLQLAIKQYTPLDNLSPKPGDVTIIAAHANGFPKELYEPLWDELLPRAKLAGFGIRGIWIADLAHQGQSGVLNERKLGNDPSWDDHPRDLFLLINHFRHQMPRPLIGIGHSIGGCQLTNLSLMHPRLFSTLVLIDPVIQRLASPEGNFAPAAASVLRRDRWPSRTQAAKAFKRSKFYQTWDPRVLDLWIKHGLRDLPTQIHPEVTASSILPALSADPASATQSPQASAEKDVTLTTTKHQEVFTFLRPVTLPTYNNSAEPLPMSVTHWDYNPETHGNLAYRPEVVRTFYDLAFLRPSVLYIF
ncbi:hypothetical protein LTR66_002739, partial [Elasticomyces elasticus]